MTLDQLIATLTDSGNQPHQFVDDPERVKYELKVALGRRMLAKYVHFEYSESHHVFIGDPEKGTELNVKVADKEEGIKLEKLWNENIQSIGINSFDEACTPLIMWLNENHNPYGIVVVEPTGAVLYGGEQSFQTSKFVKD